MYLIAIAWIYVVTMMTVAEAQSAQGSVLGAVITFVFYGVLPLTLLMYILGTPGRKRLRRAAEAAAQAQALAQSPADPAAASVAPDGGGHPAGSAVAPVGKEP
jgi:hypothetical protein